MIIDVHEGKIWAESEGHGKGSTFYFSIPIAGPKDRSVYKKESAKKTPAEANIFKGERK